MAINLTQLYEDVTLLTVKTHPPSDGIQSGQNVDPFIDDEVLNDYDDSMLDVDMEDNFIPSSETLDVWRLFGYKIQEKEPFEIRLPFHLEDEQSVVYGETSNVNDIVERAISHKSMCLEWMAVNMSYPYARSLTYAEFPTKFIWKDDSSK
ncbi:hypothetical protein Ahy_A02g008078 [Arachis hypogaea]|uniref:Uncharacterized protein n=1 Tax=Arachis hypogaea TaxID=3818 RepID=A0A445EDP5_ARAHY|nr:hypothetical protein Ahy_A02g008078 [Arachis hypogaea]